MYNPNDEAPKPNKEIGKKPKKAKDRSVREVYHRVVKDDDSNVNNPQIVQLPLIKFSLSFLQSLNKKDNYAKFKKFLEKFSDISINIPLIKAIHEMPRYVKFIKGLISKSRVVYCETIEVTHNYSAIMSSKIALK